MPWMSKELSWSEIHWPRPLEAEAVLAVLTGLATIDRFGQIVFEVRASGGSVRYLIGAERGLLERVKRLMESELPGLCFRDGAARKDVMLAKSIKLSRPQTAISTGNQEAVIRAVLAALVQTKAPGDERCCRWC